MAKTAKAETTNKYILFICGDGEVTHYASNSIEDLAESLKPWICILSNYEILLFVEGVCKNYKSKEVIDLKRQATLLFNLEHQQQIAEQKTREKKARVEAAARLEKWERNEYKRLKKKFGNIDGTST